MTSRTEGDGGTPRTCEHMYAEHSSRYDLRCTRCGVSALASEESDRRMILVWAEWSKREGNEGARQLFERVAYRLKDLREENARLRLKNGQSASSLSEGKP